MGIREKIFSVVKPISSRSLAKARNKSQSLFSTVDFCLLMKLFDVENRVHVARTVSKEKPHSQTAFAEDCGVFVGFYRGSQA